MFSGSPNSGLCHDKEAWSGCTIGDSYGLTEHTALICKCPMGNFHITSEYGLVEILKSDGTPAGPGEEGRIISTGLHNKAFPLLRYETCDFAIASDAPCPCGRTLPVVKDITGRIADTVYDSKNRLVANLHRSFRFIDGIRFSQIVQNAMGTLDVYIIPTDRFNEALREGLLKGLHKGLGQEIVIRIHLVETSPCASSAKFKFIINNIMDHP
jgi:phenylacetate-CoA ligase